MSYVFYRTSLSEHRLLPNRGGVRISDSTGSEVVWD